MGPVLDVEKGSLKTLGRVPSRTVKKGSKVTKGHISGKFKTTRKACNRVIFANFNFFRQNRTGSPKEWRVQNRDPRIVFMT